MARKPRTTKTTTRRRRKPADPAGDVSQETAPVEAVDDEGRLEAAADELARRHELAAEDDAGVEAEDDVEAGAGEVDPEEVSQDVEDILETATSLLRCVRAALWPTRSASKAPPRSVRRAGRVARRAARTVGERGATWIFRAAVACDVLHDVLDLDELPARIADQARAGRPKATRHDGQADDPPAHNGVRPPAELPDDEVLRR